MSLIPPSERPIRDQHLRRHSTTKGSLEGSTTGQQLFPTTLAPGNPVRPLRRGGYGDDSSPKHSDLANTHATQRTFR